ncbi:MAG: asparagine synthase (glutamine-hydrolyzing), partial [Deltaproteobacteria bacterium]|nr:asparagine synthase (glutamine-hydrolyzing) [Deltaproteobacteria bacterium]
MNMCGIFGYTGLTEHTDLLKNMGELLSHRGPDDVGYYTKNESCIHFGLRRLSIIDLAGGHQPIANEDQNIWVACNGEIYNYIELRRELVKNGHKFKTLSDVEVLVHLYEEQGLGFLDDVNGMFGLVLFDVRANRLILARDRLGIKPLYYSWNGNRLTFASEIKPILKCPWVSRDPDWEGISSYLHIFYIPSPRTCFKDIQKLESCTMAILEKGLLSFRSYWDPNDFLDGHKKEDINPKDASEHLLDLLKDSCRLQLRSDVPVGAFLSGGGDSSAVVGLVNSDKTRGMDTYTGAWKKAAEKMDERIFARQVAERYGCTHHELLISWEDFDRLLPRLVWHLEEPNADGAYIPTYMISRFARQKSKVILTGAGGDELFGGYGYYLRNIRPLYLLKKYFKNRLWPGLREAYVRRAFMFPWSLVFSKYRPHVAADFLFGYDRFSGRDGLNREMAFDLKVYLQDNILLLTDKMSMAASIEARVPLLDHRIVEYVIGLPSSLKLNALDKKIIFKQSVNKYLPDSILSRQKDGFGAPITSWLQGPLKEISQNLIERGRLIKLGIIDKRSLKRLEHLMRLRKNWGWALWV